MVGVQEEEEARETKEPLPPWTYLLFQLPGLLSPEQHLVPSLLVGVRHQRVSVVRPQLWEEQPSGRAGPGGWAWRGWGRSGHVCGRVGAHGAEGSCPVGEPGREQPLTRCLVFCKLFLRILRISSSLSLESAGRMRSVGSDLGWMFLGQHNTG